MKIPFRFSLFLCLIFLNQGVFSQVYYDSVIANIDAGVYSGSTGTNYGTSKSAIISSTGANHYRFFSKFNIASFNIPSNAIITSATLLLTPDGIGEGTVNSTDLILQKATASWVESTITYANQPATSSANQVLTSSLVNGKRTFNITTLVQNIVNGIDVNYGWRIHRNPETTASSQSTYGTLDNLTSTKRPLIKVSWYVPFSVSAATISHASSLTATDGSISATVINGPSSPTYKWYNSSGLISGQTNATLSGRLYGWYGLEIIGQQGNSEFMSFIIGVNCQSATISYNPGPQYIDDAKIGAFLPTINSGGAKDINASKTTAFSTWFNHKSLLKFNLWLDPTLTVNQATMSLFGKAHSYANSNASYLNKVTQSWRENTVAWVNAPTSTATNQISLATSTSSTQNYTNINTSSFWNDWKANNTSNYGMMLELQTTSNSLRAMNFHSSDTSNTSLRPKIDFIFFVNGAVAGTITPGASAICSGSTTLLTLSGFSTGATFQWQKCTDNINFVNISGATSSTYTTLGSTVVNTYYRCVVTVGTCSAVNSASQLITIKHVPTVSINNTTFCTGTSVTLTATPSIGGGTYLWNTSATTASIIVSPSITTTYTVVYTLNGCASPQGSGKVDVCASSFQYVDSTEIGQISVSINEAPSKVAPYHYKVSQFPIPTISSVYKLLKDSIYGGVLDSASFFTGSTTVPNFTFTDLKIGRQYVSVFDSRGVRIFDREVLVLPTITISNATSMSISGNVLSSTGASASTMVDLYVSDGMNGEMGYIIADKTKTQFMGFVNSTSTTPGTISSYTYGFSIKSNALYLIENGVEGTTSYTIQNGSMLNLRQIDSTLEFYSDGVLLKSSALSTTLCYKSGFAANLSGVSVQLLPWSLTKKKFYIRVKNIHYYNCETQLGGFNFNTLNNLGISNVQFTWKVYKDNVLIASSSGLTFGPINDFNSLSYGPGEYKVRTITNYGGADYLSLAYVYVGVEANWTDLIKYTNVSPNTFSLERTSTDPNTYSFARTENILLSTETGWIQFNPIIPSLGSGTGTRNILRLSTFNTTSLVPIATEIASVKFYRIASVNYIRWTGPTQGVAVIPSNSIIRLKATDPLTTNKIEIYVNNMLLNSFDRPTNSILLRAHSYNLGQGFDHVITSFNCDPKQPLSTVDYTELKRQLDGGYTLAVEGKVKFTFDEEYDVITNKYLPIKIYDEGYNLLVQSDINGVVTNENGSPSTEIIAQSYNFDDNRYQLTMSTINGLSPNSFYILEVETSTHEKRYLKILYKY